MFWGLKLESGKDYPSCVVDKSFHISHAALEVPSPAAATNGGGGVAVHVIVKKNDFIICYLDYQKGIIQQSLNLDISEGEEITVYVETVPKRDSQSPAAIVHLTGSYVEEAVDNSWDTNVMPEYNDMLGQYLSSEYDSADDTSYRIEDDPIIREVYDDECDDSQVDDILRSLPTITYKQQATTTTCSNEQETNDRKNRKRKSSKKEKQAVSVEDRSEEDEAKVSKKRKCENFTKTLSSSGTTVQELAYGHGKVAKNGRKVHIRYTGRLAGNSKVIDCIKKNEKPLVFELGKGQVIPGLERGLHGMRVGGKRKLIIPAGEGYGSKGVPPNIPPNSGLEFDVSLVNVQ